MTYKAGSRGNRDQLYAEYCRRRDDGERPDQARIGFDRGIETLGRWERAYKRARGIPLAAPNAAYSDR